MQANDWIEAYKGIGIIEKICPYFYEDWENLPEGKSVGDIAGESVLCKQLTNYDFKKSLARYSCSTDLCNPLSPKDMKKIEKVLSDEKIKKSFDKYKGKEVASIVNLSFLSSSEKTIREELEKFTSLYEEGFVMSDFKKWFNEVSDLEFDSQLVKSYTEDLTTFELQFYNKELEIKEKERLFSKVTIF